MAIRVPARRINEIVQEERGITADTALRLGRFFDVSPQFWLNLLATYDLKTTEREKGEEIASDVKPLAELEDPDLLGAGLSVDRPLLFHLLEGVRGAEHLDTNLRGEGRGLMA